LMNYSFEFPGSDFGLLVISQNLTNLNFVQHIFGYLKY
jgi:hypothetical protein